MTQVSIHEYDNLFEFRNLVKKIVISFPEVKKIHEDERISHHNLHGVKYNKNS